MNTDPGIVGDRLWGATTRLMGALHAERIAENQMAEAEAQEMEMEMVPVYKDAMIEFQTQTACAWHDCVRALEAWVALRKCGH